MNVLAISKATGLFINTSGWTSLFVNTQLFKRTFLSILTASILSLFFTACSESAPSLKIPPVEEVSVMEVAEDRDGTYKILYTTKDKEKIAAVLSFIAKHNSSNSWHYPTFDTMPILQYHIVFDGGKEEDEELVIWLGNNALGGKNINDGIGNRLSSLSQQEMQNILNLLAVSR
jgi:hypothetical protein